MNKTFKRVMLPVLGVVLCAGVQRVQAQSGNYPGPYWYVIASGGGSGDLRYPGWGWNCRYDSILVSYTVGETCIDFDHNTKFDVTEGFQQPDGYGIKPYDPYDAIEDIVFYPNPCKQFGYVSFYLNESFTDLTLKVFCMDGRQVYEDHFTAGDGKLTYQLGTSHLSPGMYIVEIVGFTKKRYVGKLVVIP